MLLLLQLCTSFQNFWYTFLRWFVSLSDYWSVWSWFIGDSATLCHLSIGQVENYAKSTFFSVLTACLHQVVVHRIVKNLHLHLINYLSNVAVTYFMCCAYFSPKYNSLHFTWLDWCLNAIYMLTELIKHMALHVLPIRISHNRYLKPLFAVSAMTSWSYKSLPEDFIVRNTVIHVISSGD